MSNRKVLVTGANGFVGQRLIEILAEAGHQVVAAVRGAKPTNLIYPKVAFSPVGDIGPSTDWTPVLHGVDVIIHLAARVHVMKESLKDPLAEYRRVNVAGTRHLALMAIRSGVERFVYVSTVKVNGENTTEKPFSENDVPSPQEAYSISKWEAEEALNDISSRTGLEIVILRPPLVYGQGVKGNMLSLMRYVDRGYPLPFGGINNKRSFISLDNLADVLLTSATKTECAGRTFLVSDGEDLSTSELIKKIAGAMNRRAHLINIPEKFYSVVGAMVPALSPIIGRLTGSLVVDSSLFRRVAGWRPCQTVNNGVKAMVSEYLLKN
jgi:nucleoside-diphosphate-sugar epimerase